LLFDYTFPEHKFLPAGGTVRVGVALTVMFACGMVRGYALVTRTWPVGICACRGYKVKKTHVAASTRKFGERADALLAAAPASKGEWGLLIIDGKQARRL